MRMRSFLTAGVGPQAAEVRDDLRIIAQGTVRLNGEGRYGPSCVIGRQQVLPAWMNSHVRRLSACSHRIEKPQCASIRIHAEGRCAARAGFISRIEELFASVQNNEGRTAYRR